LVFTPHLLPIARGILSSITVPLRGTLDDAMAQLAERDRAALVLRYFENKPMQEIAGVLKQSTDAWIELDRDPEVRVIVHTGNGRAFQTGVDVMEIATDGVGFERYRDSMENFDVHFTAWHQQVWKPVICAVNGICAGGAFHWVADSDIVIASSDAQFFDPHVSVGQVVSIEAIGMIRRMPAEAVMRMAFVGKYERMSAQRAYELGMISQIVDPPEQLREEAQKLAEMVAKNSPTAMRQTKKALWGALEAGLTDACKAGAQHLVAMWGHPDQEEGPAAFAEKREPDWEPLGRVE
jgi:enoyl-CoA hydratase/carnithine racemase